MVRYARGMACEAIDKYHSSQTDNDRLVCDTLRAEINRGLPDAHGKVWHAHPVWFLSGNPIVGYSKLKDCIRLLFWSGQSFPTPGLSAEGKFKAAEKRFLSVSDTDRDLVQHWLRDAKTIQWDYKNIVKRKGRLERLT